MSSIITSNAESGKAGLQLLTARELLNMEFPDAVDLLEGQIRKQSLVFLAGETGAGKSILASNLSISVADGRETFLGRKLLGPGGVIYINAELYPSDFRDRLSKMKLLEGHDRLMINGPIGDRELFWETLVRHTEERHPALVVVDPIYYLHDKDEKDNSDMKEIIRRLISLRDVHNTCLFVVHHMRKGVTGERLSTDSMRGAGVLSHSADTVYLLKRSVRDDKKRVFAATKLRHGSDGARTPRLLALNEETLWFSDIGEAEEADYYEPFVPQQMRKPAIVQVLAGKQAVTRSEILKEVKVKTPSVCEKTIDRDLKKLVSSGEVMKEGHGKYALVSSEQKRESSATVS